jgi:hypothetical protein
MEKDKVLSLLNFDTSAYQENISTQALQELDKIILDNSYAIFEEVFNIYKKFVPMKDEAPDSMKIHLFSTMYNFIKEQISKEDFVNALFLSRFLIVKTSPNCEIYFNIANCAFHLGAIENAKTFLKIYEKKEQNIPLRLITLANFYNLELQDYKTAIKYYEKYLEIDKTKAVIYTILANLYKKEYGDLMLKEQIQYLEKAYNLKPTDRGVLHCLAFSYEKIKDKEKVKFYYEKLLENNPTETDFYNFGAFLISCGDFITGHKYFAHRFNIDDVNFEYPSNLNTGKKWDFKSDISNKTLLVHYEQGFGDTIMYCRFLPDLKKLCKKLIFVCQPELCNLLKSSKTISDGILITNTLENLEYDTHMTLLDAPLALKTETTSIPFKTGYLEVSKEKNQEYAKTYIKNSDKLKIGIAYHGDKSANYNGRDINFEQLKPLFEIENIDFYSLQVTEDEEDGIISLGKSFKDFADTACAIKNMDMVITTDNVILNLSGALGVKTFGLFNNLTNFRWYNLSSDVGWYTSVKPFQVKFGQNWDFVISEVLTELKKL